jgi:hypothetical protein
MQKPARSKGVERQVKRKKAKGKSKMPESSLSPFSFSILPRPFTPLLRAGFCNVLKMLGLALFT